MAFFFPVLVATLAAASPLSSLVTKHSIAEVPQGWERQADAPADHGLQLHIRLREENMDRLQQRLLEVSNPKHADYGKHLSKADVDALTAPTPAAVDSVTKWLSANGVDVGKPRSGYLKVSLTVAEAKKLIGADYGIYKQAATGQETVRATSYSLPKEVFSAISMIQPTTMFADLGSSFHPYIVDEDDLPKRRAANAKSDDICANGFTTDCLRSNYNIQGYNATADSTTIGIAGFLGEVPNQGSLSTYIKKYQPSVPADTEIPIVSINDGPTDGPGGGEADLDVQIAVPLTYPMKSVYYSTGGSPPWLGTGNNTNEPYLEWLSYMINLDNPPETISISYGDDERTVPADYADCVCSQFMKLGARGVTILSASGDDGVATYEDCSGDTIKQFAPSFPASCPWVTVVGGTEHYGDDEAAYVLGGSGFSNHFAAPSYQQEAVGQYIDGLDGQFDGLYNKTGRAYPDIAASFTPYPIFNQGKAKSSGGTSASTPAVASMIALLNDYLVSNGQSPLGFLNPWLYSYGKEGFRDIAKGHNNACINRKVKPRVYGQPALPATEGWDAVTGWGVPNFAKLLDLL